MATDITDLFAVNPHAAYYIKGIVNSYPVKFMLDTGAAVSLLDINVWNAVKGGTTLSSWDSPGLVGVAGTPLQVHGTTELQVDLGGWRYPMNVIVAESLRTEAILGRYPPGYYRCQLSKLEPYRTWFPYPFIPERAKSIDD